MLCSLGKTTWPAPEAMLDALPSVALKQKSVWCGYERESIVNATTFTNAFIRIYIEIYCSYTIPKKNSWHLLAMDDSLLYKLYSSLRQCITCNLKKRINLPEHWPIPIFSPVPNKPGFPTSSRHGFTACMGTGWANACWKRKRNPKTERLSQIIVSTKHSWGAWLSYHHENNIFGQGIQRVGIMNTTFLPVSSPYNVPWNSQAGEISPEAVGWDSWPQLTNDGTSWASSSTMTVWRQLRCAHKCSKKISHNWVNIWMETSLFLKYNAILCKQKKTMSHVNQADQANPQAKVAGILYIIYYPTPCGTNRIPWTGHCNLPHILELPVSMGPMYSLQGGKLEIIMKAEHSWCQE